MSRRCKPGQRARIIVGTWNHGKVVLIVRAYFGEEIDGAIWPYPLFPWVVSSFGAPLRSCWSETDREAAPRMLAVYDDCDLEPLDDDDDGLDESTDTDKPANLEHKPA